MRTSPSYWLQISESEKMTIEDQRRYYLAKRAEHGADTPIGHRCSNAIEQLEQLTSSNERAVREIAELELAEML